MDQTDLECPANSVVIIGSGGAGLACAIEVVQKGIIPIVLTKGTVYDGKTASAQGGIQAAVSDLDSCRSHFDDTIRAGGGKAKSELVRLLVDNAEETIKWLESCGVEFDRDGDKYRLSNAAGLSSPRILSAGDRAGKGIAEALLEEARKYNIDIREQTVVRSIERLPDKRFALHINSGRKSKRILTNCVVLAAGGAVPKEKRPGISNREIDCPDSLELAAMVGCNVIEPNLMQYHPTGIVEPMAMRRKRLPETIRGAGARLLNRYLEPFTDSLSTRNILSNAIVEECRQGRGVETNDGRRGVWLNTPDVDHLNGSGYFKERFPAFYEMFRENGHDPNTQPVLVYPVVHYSLGGIEIGENSETNVPGLFAAGEATWGVHGIDRLMGNSLLDIFVFGRIAGKSVVNYLQEIDNE